MKILIILAALTMMLSKAAPALATACTCVAGSAACFPDYTTQAASLAACNSAASAAGQTACIQYSAFKCPDQKYDGVTATFFPFYPSGCGTSPFTGEDGECLDSDPNLCEGDNKIRILNEQGFLESCVDTSPPDPTQCTQVFGMADGITLCDDARAQCEATGGSFGYAGAADNMDPICTTPESSVPICASGSMMIVDLGAGDGAFACLPVDDLSIEVCDAQLYDCDGDGNIDDQNQNGLTDNGTADTGEATGGGSGVADAGEGLNVGFDEFEVQTTGSGQCDPTSTNYAECIGQGGGITGEQSAKSGFGSFDAVNGSMSDRIDAAPIVGMFSSITGVFSTAGVCPSPSFDAFGQTFMINYHCTLYNSISGILSALMLIVFSIVGIRHIASA